MMSPGDANCFQNPSKHAVILPRLRCFGLDINLRNIAGTMPTLIFTPRYTDDSQALWKAAASRGWRTERLTNWRIPEHVRTLPEPVLYGEALFGPMLAQQLGLSLVSPPDDWLAVLPREYKLRDIVLTTMGQARGVTGKAFIKPPNDKSFPAGVYSGTELPTEFDDTMPVLVSQVVSWTVEFRCFVLDRKVMSYSAYSRFGEPLRDAGFTSTPEEDLGAEAFIGRLLADRGVQVEPATVIDIGVIDGAGWACVEQNAAWGAGIYGCEPGAVLDVVRAASRSGADNPRSVT